jgi:hypothetical protein
MRTLLSTEQSSSSIYPRYSTKSSYGLSSDSSSSSSYRLSNTKNQNEKQNFYDENTKSPIRIPIERHDLSPVSKFREEQKGYIYKSKLSPCSSSSSRINNNNRHMQSNYKSSMLSDLPETPARTTAAYKSNKTSPINYYSTNASTSNSNKQQQYYEKTKHQQQYHTENISQSVGSGSGGVGSSRYNKFSPYRVIKYTDNEDDKLY